MGGAIACTCICRRGLTNRLLNLERHKPGTQRAEAMASNSLPRKRGRGRPATAAGGPKISILLGRGSRAQTIRKEVESIQKDYGLDTLGDTIEFLCAKWKRYRAALGINSGDLILHLHNPNTNCSNPQFVL